MSSPPTASAKLQSTDTEPSKQSGTGAELNVVQKLQAADATEPNGGTTDKSTGEQNDAAAVITNTGDGADSAPEISASKTTAKGSTDKHSSSSAEKSPSKKVTGLGIDVTSPTIAGGAGDVLPVVKGPEPSDTSNSSSPPPPPPKDEKYLPSPRLGANAMADQQQEGEGPKERQEGRDVEAAGAEETEDVLDDSRSEIQSIMGQFEDGMGGPGEEEIMSPRLEKAGPMFGSPSTHPPRKSSLEALSSAMSSASADAPRGSNSSAVQSPPPRTSSLISLGSAASLRRASSTQEAPSSPLTPQTSRSLPPPPQPDPESELPFDFHRFLEQLRHRTADPVAKFLRSFLLEFAKRQWMVHEQVKIISDFLEFISKKMGQCEVWKNVSDSEFDNAREGMEKLVMNRLYSQTFSPAIPASEVISGPKDKRKPGQPARTVRGPGRRGQHQEDVERDEILAQKVRIYGWVKEEHLDIKPLGDKGRKFMSLAQQELLKIKSYRAPRDKVICILNCCKVIFGFLRNSQHDQSADSFIPLLIYTVLKANPDHLVSNVQYILRFRNQDKLGGEAGYYISSLMGAVQFVENLDRTSLSITDEEFEQNVEAAVSAIAEGHKEEEPPKLPARQPSSEKAQLSRGESSTAEAEQNPPRKSPGQRSGTKSDDDSEENAAVTGLLRTIQRPLSTIGRMFSDEGAMQEKSSGPSLPPSTPQPPSSNRPLLDTRTSDGSEATDAARQERRTRVQQSSAEDAAARQASAEVEEARKIREREEGAVVETLCGMFPSLDREVIQDVVRANEGRVGSAVDACLALGS